MRKRSPLSLMGQDVKETDARDRSQTRVGEMRCYLAATGGFS